ncbi:iron-containing alcohol dehydrogenase [Sphingopyxis sp. NJF-3]
MHDISLGRIPAIRGAAGAARGLGAHAAALTTAPRTLVMLDPALAEPGPRDAILAGLAASGITASVFVMPAGEPKESTVEAAAEQASGFEAGSLIAVGGGSTLDSGKIVANLVHGHEGIEAYRLAAAALPPNRLPLICVPTTAGTGAEATSVSVLSASDGTKYWFWADGLKPDLIVHDPELMIGLPASITALTGIDALVHAVEAATNRNASPANNLYAWRAIALICEHLPVAISSPTDLAARAGLLEAATCAGIAIDNAGTAIAHNIGHALGSLAAVPHGRAVAIGMCASLAWNVEAVPDVYAPVADAMGVAGGPKKLPEFFEAFVRQVGVDLSALNVAPHDLAEQMARPENAAMLASNRREALKSDLAYLAQSALSLAS